MSAVSHRAVIKTPIGKLMIIEENGKITNIERTEAETVEPKGNILKSAAAWLDKYFKKENPGNLSFINPKGTDFQKQVWEILIKIPYGKTTTYKEIASALGKPNAARAIGQAVGKNPILILIPCHRVLAKNGIGGFGAGIENKLKLLSIENIEV